MKIRTHSDGRPCVDYEAYELDRNRWVARIAELEAQLRQWVQHGGPRGEERKRQQEEFGG